MSVGLVALICMPIFILIQAPVVLAHKELELVVLDHTGLGHTGLGHMGLEEVDMARAAMVLTLAQVCCFLESRLETDSTISACIDYLSIMSCLQRLLACPAIVHTSSFNPFSLSVCSSAHLPG